MTTNDVTTNSDVAVQHFVVMQVGQSPIQALNTVEPDSELLFDAASKGAIWLKRRKPNGQMAKLVRLRDLGESILDGSELFANINKNVLSAAVDAPTLIEQHKNYSFWFKPRGVLSQGSKWGDHTSMPYLVQASLNRATHLVHRLDQNACGLMVLAHTRPAVKALTALFAKRKVQKNYQVIVQGTWAHDLPFRCEEPLDDRNALSIVEKAETLSAAEQSQLQVQLHTGRKHQIRRHLASIEHPVLGDSRYGDSSSDRPLALMATELKFECPFSDQSIQCSVPSSFLNTL